MFEPLIGGEFTNFNAASARTLKNFFKALTFWFFFIKKKEQIDHGKRFCLEVD
jgi:hypothetical protein